MAVPVALLHPFHGNTEAECLPHQSIPAMLLPKCFSPPGTSLVLVVLHHTLHVHDLCVLAHLLRIEEIHLLLQVADVVLQDGLQVVGPSRRVYLLQELPFCLQHLILLLQESDLRARDLQVLQVVGLRGTPMGRRMGSLIACPELKRVRVGP